MMVNTGDEGIKNKFSCDLKHLFHDKPGVLDDGLVQAFHNVGLETSHSHCSSKDFNEVCSDDDDGNIMQHPIRPHADDCSFFIRTGTCKFGSTCKFNHPVSNKYMVDREKSNGNGVESSSKILSEVPCKFYSSGLCKYGQFCKFNHPKSEAEKSPLQLNILGLPERLGKTECSFYMRTGMCEYGASCRYHHPDPIFVLEPALESLAVTGETMNNHNKAAVINDAGYVLQFSDSTQSYLSLPQITPEGFSYVHQSYGLSVYQAPEYKQEVRSSSSSPAENVKVFEDYREDSPKREPCVLNEVGLPIRLGKKACWNYKNLGLCKWGCACAYDHSKKYPSTDGATSESSSGKMQEPQMGAAQE